MGRYILLRLLGLLGVLLGVSMITFLMMHAIPGGPFEAEQMPVSETVRAHMAQKYGLDQPLWRQYLTYLSNAVHLDFGVSFQSPGETVGELIGRTWPVTAHLGAMTLIVAFTVGLTLGILASLRQNSTLDHVATLIAVFGLVTPQFVIAIGLLVIFSTNLKMLPTGGWGEPVQWIMPVLAYAMHPTAVIARYTRASMLEAIRADYVRTAYAKGLSARRVILGHVFKNALIPLMTITGPLVPSIITGSFFIEIIFRIPGLGKYFTTSVFNRDYPMIMALTLLWCSLIAVTYLATDILYVVVDPRIRYQEDK